MMVIFSNYLSNDNRLIGEVFKSYFKLSQSQMPEIFNLSKIGLFHIINRFNLLKKHVKLIENKPIKRKFE
jgi:hypothetical protein